MRKAIKTEVEPDEGPLHAIWDSGDAIWGRVKDSVVPAECP